jgi:hypothetical protein
VAIRWVLIRDHQEEFDSQALLTTNLQHRPEQVLQWFRRWTMEVTFEEARAHLGVETQRPWNDLAIGRTTPALLGLYSLVTLTAEALLKGEMQVAVVRLDMLNSSPRSLTLSPWFAEGCGVIAIFQRQYEILR